MIDTSDLTLAITNFKRAGFLGRCLAHAHAAGIENVVIASACPDEENLKMVDSWKDKFKRFRFTKTKYDVGCHNLWILAAYNSFTERLILMHDDDVLAKEFGETYTNVIKPVLDSGKTGIASWRAHLLFMDSTTKPTEYFTNPFGKVNDTGLYPVTALEKIVGKKGRLSLSPVVSVMNRKVLIHALKECSQFITSPKCIHHQGMLLGTEILAYLRHCSAYRSWFFCSEVLSYYGSHNESGTVAAQKTGDLTGLTTGYDVVRDHFANNAKFVPEYKPKLILIYNDIKPADCAESLRFKNAYNSWEFHFNQMDMIELPFVKTDSSRSSIDIGDSRETFYFKDILDFGCSYAMPEDVVCYINRDIGLTTMAPERILDSAKRNNGVTIAFRRNLNVEEGRLYKTVRNAKPDGGFDVMCVTPLWWASNKNKMPDMFIGREAFDTVFRNIIRESMSKKPSALDDVHDKSSRFWELPYFVDDVCYHHPHEPYWLSEKTKSLSQLHNRKLAREFFRERGNKFMLGMLDGEDARKEDGRDILASFKNRANLDGKRTALVMTTYNQIDILPFTLRHYEKFVDKIIVWDDESTDGTRELLENHPLVQLHKWPHEKGINESVFIDHAYSVYPKLAGKFDWIIWADPDEFIYAPDIKTVLFGASAAGIEVIRSKGYNMIGRGLPDHKSGKQIWELLQTGVYSHEYSKPIVFNPRCKIEWDFGKHYLVPGIQVKASKTPLVKLLHYRYLGSEYTMAKNKKNYDRLNMIDGDKKLGWSCSPENEGLHSPKWAEEKLKGPVINAITDKL